MAHLEMFPEERLRLQQELTHHPELCELVANHPPQEFELRLAEIAAYCEVLLDGLYSQEELNKLCDILTRRLISKRTGFLLEGVQEVKH